MAHSGDLSCPRGGKFYVCTGSAKEFLGCCTSNPCANGGECPADDRKVSSFSLDVYPNIQEQSCDDPRPAKEIWWTCKNEHTNTFPFIGCCATNPCNETDGLCPIDNLIPATLSKDSSARAFFVASEDASPTPSASASATSTPESGSGGGLATGAIVGIAIGAAVAVGVIIAIVWRCGWHARKRNERREPNWEPASPGRHPEMGFASSPHSPSPYDPSRSPRPYDPARSSFATTTVQGSYASTSPPHSPYYGLKHASPVIDNQRMSTYADSNVSSMTSHTPHARHINPSAVGVPELHTVSELDGVEHYPPVVPPPPPQEPKAPLAELGDGMPTSKK
ncbi:hypothetical protein CGCF415_v002767 [Colletotrichum fructicola]|nr:hypothetical protein CGCF415_v002767 [Colletotrichum fructicola]KAF4938127.1 hypothetical protein CGCF245_v004890 [Colletotrichum fructicola]KAF5499346.1 hypothetical protein CGCF413_v006222 [Colletotrichum fructicola]